MICNADQGNLDDNIKQNSDPSFNQAIQTARAARDAAVKEATRLQQELDMLKKKNHKTSPGSIRLAITAGLIGIMVGLLLKLVLSSPLPIPPPPTPPPTAAVAG